MRQGAKADPWMIWVHGDESGWERIDLHLEESNEMINFLVAHLDLRRCIEGDVRAATLDLRAVRRELTNRRRATIFLPAA